MNISVALLSIWNRPWFWAPLAALSSGALIAIPGLFPQWYLLGWITFVPFLLGLRLCRNTGQAYGFGLLTGFFTFSLGTYWMAEFIQLYKHYSVISSVGLASLYWIYCAQQFAIIAVITHWLTRNGRNALLWAFPTTLALVLALFPVPFPWQVGIAQSEFLVAIQATEIAGVSGLDFILGLVAVLIVQALPQTSAQQQVTWRSASVAYTVIAVWFIYGFVSLAYWDKTISKWDTLKVGIVQPDEPPVIGTPGPRPNFTLGYPIEMDLTEKLVNAGAELVIWPELRDKQYFSQAFVREAYQRQVKEFRTPLLLQSPEQSQTGDQTLTFNTAVLIDEHGQQNNAYRKIKRIAFAEYLPLFERSEVVTRWAREYLGEFFGNYSAGPEPKRFDIDKASIKPFICYEIMFPQFVGSSTAATGGDIFVVQSNNGWFGDTRVPYPHMAGSVLRSVENRRPLVHVMNNGLGGIVLPNGRVLLRTKHHDVAGYLVDMSYRKDGTLTFYSRFPYWFVSLLGVALALMSARATISAKPK